MRSWISHNKREWHWLFTHPLSPSCVVPLLLRCCLGLSGCFSCSSQTFCWLFSLRTKNNINTGTEIRLFPLFFHLISSHLCYRQEKAIHIWILGSEHLTISGHRIWKVSTLALLTFNFSISPTHSKTMLLFQFALSFLLFSDACMR